MQDNKTWRTALQKISEKIMAISGFSSFPSSFISTQNLVFKGPPLVKYYIS